MERYIPFEKLSKRKQRELSAKRRGSWGGISPVTRRPKNPRAYDRKKTPRWDDSSSRRGVLLWNNYSLRTSLPMDL